MTPDELMRQAHLTDALKAVLALFPAKFQPGIWAIADSNDGLLEWAVLPDESADVVRAARRTLEETEQGAADGR